MSGDRLGHFYTRTWAHIRRVQQNALVLVAAGCVEADVFLRQVATHDLSKFKEPEFSTYVEITWMYRCRREGRPFEMTDDLKRRMAEATLHHVKANSHHPEHWAPTAAINVEDRDAPPGGALIDGSAMNDISLAEMCCDWTSMSQEKLGTNSAHGWAEQNIGVRWGFDAAQVERIYELLDILQRDCPPVPTEEKASPLDAVHAALAVLPTDEAVAAMLDHLHGEVAAPWPAIRLARKYLRGVLPQE